MAVGELSSAGVATPAAGTTAPAAVDSAAPTPAPAGPAAWDESWRTRFTDAGAPPELVQQLMMTGAMGATEAELEKLLAGIKDKTSQAIEKFAAEHPEEFTEIKASGKFSQFEIAQFAASVNSGDLKEDEMKTQVETATSTPGKMAGMLVTEGAPYMLVPAWGTLRFAYAAAPFTPNQDPLSGRDIHMDFWDHGFIGWMDVVLAATGVVTIGNTIRGAAQVSRGSRLGATAPTGSLAATVAEREGLTKLGTFGKAWSYVPGTASNRSAMGLSRLTPEFEAAIARLEGEPRRYANLFLEKLRAGDIALRSEPTFKLSKIGGYANVRGTTPLVGNRFRDSAHWSTHKGQTVLNIDAGLTGDAFAARLAAEGTQLAPKANPALAATTQRLATEAAAAGVAKPKAAGPVLRNQMLAEAGAQLGVSKPTGAALLWNKFRPNGVTDIAKAQSQLASGKLYQPSWFSQTWAHTPMWGKVAGAGAIAAGVGYGSYRLAMSPLLFGESKDAPKEAPKADDGSGSGAEGGGGADAAQKLPGMPETAPAAPAEGAAPNGGAGAEGVAAAVEALQGLTPEQQMTALQEQVAILAEAAADPNSAPEDQAALEQSAADIIAVAEGLGIDPATLAPAAPVAAPAAPAETEVAVVPAATDAVTPVVPPATTPAPAS